MLVGPGEGSVVSILGPGVTVRGLTIRGSGDDLAEMESGVFVGKEGDGALIEGNRLDGNLFGVYLWGPDDAIVRGNTIIGRPESSGQREGPRRRHLELARLAGGGQRHHARRGRDLHARQPPQPLPRQHHARAALRVHYMYTNDSEVSGNVSIDNDVGYAIMFSERLKVAGNRSEGDRDHGLMFNYANRSVMEGNVIRDGGDQCVFIYNANFNDFRGNWFEGCAIGDPLHRRLGAEHHRRQRLHRQPVPGQVRRHPLPRLVRGRARQLLERQPRLRPRRRRDRRHRLSPERHHRPGALDQSLGQDPGDDPRGAGDPLGAGAVPRAPARRRHRQRAADGAPRDPAAAAQ